MINVVIFRGERVRVVAILIERVLSKRTLLLARHNERRNGKDWTDDLERHASECAEIKSLTRNHKRYSPEAETNAKREKTTP